jgi:hypothetical protein
MANPDGEKAKVEALFTGAQKAQQMAYESHTSKRARRWVKLVEDLGLNP